MSCKPKNVFQTFTCLFILVIVVTWSLHVYLIRTTPFFIRQHFQKMFNHNVMLALTTNDNGDIITTIKSINNTNVMLELTTNDNGDIITTIKSINSITHGASVHIFLNGNVTNFDFISNISILYPDVRVITLQDYGDHGSYVRRIMHYFLLSLCEVLVFVDSGMIVSEEWWKVLQNGLKFTPDVFSLYRFPSHDTHAKDCINAMCRNRLLEIAGTVWNKATVHRILTKINSSSDFKWADWCNSNDIGMYSLKHSLLTYINVAKENYTRSGSLPKSISNENGSVIEFYYEPFIVKRPYLLSNSDLFIFNYSLNMEIIAPISDIRLLRGVVQIKTNATYDAADDCGYRANYSRHYVRNNTKGSRPTIHFAKLCPLLVPEGHTFQHFVDGVLPKLAQAYEILQTHKDMYFLFPNIIGSSMVYEIWRELGFSKKQIILHRPGRTYRASLLFLVCKTPPMHPQLWSIIRKLLNVHKECKKDKIIILSRTHFDANKPSRYIINQRDVFNKLFTKYGDRVVLYRFKDYPSLSKVKQLFCRAQYIIGSHGGAMYNILFAPASATLIEYMPTTKDTGQPVGGIAHAIFWVLSYHIGQAFWRVPDTSHGDNVFIDWIDLLSILQPNYTIVSTKPQNQPLQLDKATKPTVTTSQSYINQPLQLDKATKP